MMRIRQAGSIEREKKYGGYVFVAPWIIGFLVFFIYPLIKTILLSFSNTTDINELSHIKLSGSLMYQEALFSDPDYLSMFASIVGQTVIHTILILIFSLFVAILLNKKLIGTGALRVIFFLPVILGTGTLATMVVDNDTANSVIALNADMLTNVLSSDMAEVVLNLLGALSRVFWRSSVQMVIYLSGLQGIPDSLYESADCDGASAWEAFWKITLPMLVPITAINLIYTIIDSFTSSDNSLLVYIYKKAFVEMKFSSAAAMSVVYLAFVLIFAGVAYTIVSLRTARSEK